MAIYRNIQMSFWTDTKVMDEFSPDQKLLYLYLLTNPHTNLSGCYEISKRQIAYETGMTAKQVNDNLSALQDDLRVVVYSDKTKEILLVNWSKYNWTASEKFRKPLEKEILSVKDEEFRQYLSDLLDGADTVSIPYEYGTDTTVTVTVTDTVTDTDTDKHKRYEDIKELYNTTCKSLPRIKTVSKQRETQIRTLAKTYEREDFVTVFNKAEASDFLTGRTGKWNGCGFDWLIKPANFLKVLEGTYDNSKKARGFNNATERSYDFDDLELKLIATN